MKGVSQQLKFNHYCGLFITSFIYACRNLNFKLQLCAVIKFRANLKVALLAHVFFMSRLIIVCRDITKLWEDIISSGCDIRHFMTYLSCRNLHHSFEGIVLVTTQMFYYDLNFCRDITFGRNLCPCSSFSTY